MHREVRLWFAKLSVKKFKNMCACAIFIMTYPIFESHNKEKIKWGGLDHILSLPIWLLVGSYENFYIQVGYKRLILNHKQWNIYDVQIRKYICNMGSTKLVDLNKSRGGV